MKNERNSNIELLRIIAMLMIIAHHFVVNSTVGEKFDYTSISALGNKAVFLLVFGAFGKASINIFILISGYYLCKRVTLKYANLLRIWSTYKLYLIIFTVVFSFCGYCVIDKEHIYNILWGLISSFGNGFLASFLVFYLFVPFYNMLIKTMTKKQHYILIVLSLFVFTDYSYQSGTAFL